MQIVNGGEVLMMESISKLISRVKSANNDFNKFMLCLHGTYYSENFLMPDDISLSLSLQENQLPSSHSHFNFTFPFQNLSSHYVVEHQVVQRKKILQFLATSPYHNPNPTIISS